MGPSKSLLKESDLAESGSYFADLFALFLSFTQLTTKINGDCHLKKKSIWPRVLGTFDFFSRHYFGIRNTKNSRRPAVFPIECWNVHDRIRLNKPRTNNEVEGWHRGFQVCTQTYNIFFYWPHGYGRSHECPQNSLGKGDKVCKGVDLHFINVYI